jgi:hypothetical protein
MADAEGQQHTKAGPFEQFLQQSAVYREFLECSGTDQSEVADAQAMAGLRSDGPPARLCVDLEIARARLAMTLDVANRSHPSATIVFPSRTSCLELGDLHRCIRRVIDAAYPRRGLTPQVALVANGSETRLDLASYWDGALYESALADSSLTAVIYYLQIQHSLARVPLLNLGSTLPDLMYGFMPAYDESREFISISYLQARHISVDLVSVLLSRHRDYVEGDLLADAEQLAEQIRAICKAHAPQMIP